MKKIVLLTGTLLSVGVLASCGSQGKKANDINMAIAEFDEKFQLPSGLIRVDDQVGEYIKECAQDNFTSGAHLPKKSTYTEASRINRAQKNKNRTINGGSAAAAATDITIGGQDVFDNSVPVDDSSYYESRLTEEVSLYDNYLYEDTVKDIESYVEEGGYNIRYSDIDNLYDTWYEESKESNANYEVKRYVKETKAIGSGEFDYVSSLDKAKSESEAKKLIEKGIIKANKMMLSKIESTKLNKTDVEYSGKYEKEDDPFKPFNINSTGEGGRLDPSDPLLPGGFGSQIQYYRSKDFKTVYAYSSDIATTSCRYPSTAHNKSVSPDEADPKDVVNLYQVITSIFKFTKFGDAMNEWQCDYLGTFGKSYADKDDNLILYEKPKCIASEYYIAECEYKNLGDKSHPSIEDVEEYDIEETFKNEFGGFAVQAYKYTISDMHSGPTYEDFTSPVGDDGCIFESNIIYSSDEEERQQLHFDDGNSALYNFRDVTVDYRKEYPGKYDNEYVFEGKWSYYAPLLETDKDGKTVGYGRNFCILEKQSGDIKKEFYLNISENQNRIVQNDDQFYYNNPTQTIISAGDIIQKYADEDGKECPMFPHIGDADYVVTVVVGCKNDDLTLDHLSIEFESSHGGEVHFDPIVIGE